MAENHSKLAAMGTWGDVRYGARTLRRSPVFCVVAVLSLALGIGANTAIFSIINALTLRDLPVQDPARLVTLTSSDEHGAPIMGLKFSTPMLWQLRRNHDIFSGVLGWSFPLMTVEARGAVAPAATTTVTGDFFPTLGVPALLGRTIDLHDEQNETPVAVLAYDYWQTTFGGDPKVLGQTVRIDRAPFEIAGVLGREFKGPQVGSPTALYIPITAAPFYNGRPNGQRVALDYAMGRLRPGISRAQAAARLSALWPALLAEAMPKSYTPEQARKFVRRRIGLEPGSTGISFLRERFSRQLNLLMGAVALVLLIACINLAGLLLARAAMRRQEVAVRTALGARPWQVVRQFLAESVVLSGAGAILGLLLAQWLCAALVPFLSVGNTDVRLAVQPDSRVLAFTIAAAVAAGLLSGVAPAAILARHAVGGFTGARVSPGGQSRGFLRLIVSAQLALSLILVIGTGLFVRSLANLRDHAAPRRDDRILVLQLIPLPGGYQGGHLEDYYRALLARTGAAPGVRSAALLSRGLLDNLEFTQDVSAGDKTAAADINQVSPRFFDSLNIQLVDGRDFSDRDNSQSAPVAVVSRTLARRLFPGSGAVGQIITAGAAGARKDYTIVGIVEDTALHDLRRPAAAALYTCYFQAAALEYPTMLVRSSGSAGAIAAAVREQLKSLGRELPLSVRTLAEQSDRALSQERLLATLSAFFGGLSLALACLGLYGALAYAVERRQREIGIRMAIGAGQPAVVWLVLRESMLAMGLGLAIGIPLALASGRAVTSLLFGVNAADPTIFIAAMAPLVIAGAIATWLPARRASRVDPVTALRNE